jgi:hypothetical protein
MISAGDMSPVARRHTHTHLFPLHLSPLSLCLNMTPWSAMRVYCVWCFTLVTLHLKMKALIQLRIGNINFFIAVRNVFILYFCFNGPHCKVHNAVWMCAAFFLSYILHVRWMGVISLLVFNAACLNVTVWWERLFILAFWTEEGTTVHSGVLLVTGTNCC